MAFTAFDATLGTAQGRLEPIGFEPTSGEFAFVLGSDLPGHIHNLEVGDFGELRQDVDLTAENFLRARIRLRNADTIPAAVNWEASITVDGVKKARTVLALGRTRDRADMAANVSKETGVHTVGLRLELVAV